MNRIVNGLSLLREFNKDDAAEILKIEDQFTISYEIELLSKQNMNEFAEDQVPEFTTLGERDFIKKAREHDADWFYDSHEVWSPEEVLHRWLHFGYERTEEEQFQDLWVLNIYFQVNKGAHKNFLNKLGKLIEDPDFALRLVSLVSGFEDETGGIVISLMERLHKILGTGIDEESPDLGRLLEMLRNNEEDLLARFVGQELQEYIEENIIDFQKEDMIPEAAESDYGGTLPVRFLFMAMGDASAEDGFYAAAKGAFMLVIDQYILGFATLGDLYDTLRGAAVKKLKDRSELLSSLFDEFDALVDGEIDQLSSYFEGQYEQEIEEFINDNGYDPRYYHPGSEDYDKDDPRYHDALTEHLPNFMSEWSDYISMEPDASLSGENYGVEIMMQTYLDGIEEAFGFLDDFYADFDKQDNFYMKDGMTGLHINIGMTGTIEDSDKQYNFVKGYLFLNEAGEKEMYRGRAGKGLGDQRQLSQWTGGIKDRALSEMGKYVHFEKENGRDPFAGMGDDIRKSLKSGEISKIEELLSNAVLAAAQMGNIKYTGFNISYAGPEGKVTYDDTGNEKRGSKLVEFRYPGGVITEEVVKDLTLYYCHLVYVMLEPRSKQKEYVSKLTKLISEIGEHEIGKEEFSRVAMAPGSVLYATTPSDLGIQFESQAFRGILVKLPNKDGGAFVSIGQANAFIESIGLENTQRPNLMAADVGRSQIMFRIKSVIGNLVYVEGFVLEQSGKIVLKSNAISREQFYIATKLPINKEIFEKGKKERLLLQQNLKKKFDFAKKAAGKKGYIPFSWDYSSLEEVEKKELSIRADYMNKKLTQLVKRRDSGDLNHGEYLELKRALIERHSESWEAYQKEVLGV